MHGPNGSEKSIPYLGDISYDSTVLGEFSKNVGDLFWSIMDTISVPFSPQRYCNVSARNLLLYPIFYNHVRYV